MEIPETYLLGARISVSDGLGANPSSTRPPPILGKLSLYMLISRTGSWEVPVETVPATGPCTASP